MSAADRDDRVWTDPDNLRRRIRKEWDSGRIPSALLEASPPAYPLRIALRGPNSSELGERFAESRAWIAALVAAEGLPGFQLEWRSLEHRQLGSNRVPVAAIFADVDDAVAFIGKKREAALLRELAGTIEAAFPVLGPWLRRRPHEVLERREEWPALLGAIAWFRDHPRSGRYARQIDASGVHSKFVESRRGLLSELLDLVLDPALYPGAIDESARRAVNFTQRYGLRDKPTLARFRSLDPGLALGVAGLSSVGEISLRTEDFARLFPEDRSPFAEIFITENEINFLAFPERSGAAIVLGAGYGFAHLSSADWLRRTRLRYWGDLDSHGFAILDQFRASFPDASSFLMDRETLLAHRDLWTSESSRTRAELPRLKPEEAALYDELRFDRLAPALRLEQERVNFSWIEAALQRRT